MTQQLELDFGQPVDVLSEAQLSALGVTVEEIPVPAAVTPVPQGNAVRALQAENKQRVPQGSDLRLVLYNGDTYVIGDPAEWDIQVFEDIEDQRLVTAVRAILGPVQWVKFKSKKPNAAEFGKFFKEVNVLLSGDGTGLV
jgi:hypothetical protein